MKGEGLGADAHVRWYLVGRYRWTKKSARRWRDAWLWAWNRSVQTKGLHDDCVEKRERVNGFRRRKRCLVGAGREGKRGRECIQFLAEGVLQERIERELVEKVCQRDGGSFVTCSQLVKHVARCSNARFHHSGVCWVFASIVT